MDTFSKLTKSKTPFSKYKLKFLEAITKNVILKQLLYMYIYIYTCIYIYIV